MNENSETVELPLTDSICPARLTFFGSGFRTGVRDRATGPGYGTRDNDADTGAIQSSGTRA